MKKYLLFFNIYLQDRIKSYLFFTLILIPCLVIGQSITPTKTVTKNPNSCSIIDVELKIQGANPISRPLEVVLVVDVSGSMGNTISGDTNTSMDYAKDAATDFINTFFLPANNPTNLNRLAIVTYATTGTLRQGLTLSSGKAGLLTIINGLTANGNTNIQDGIVKADNELIANATYNCTTARSIVLLTDGVANRTGTGGSSCTSGTGGTCIQSAITAANNAKTHTVSSVVYYTQIFSVGLFGGISGTDQNNSEYCLNNIQSGGAYFTESGANLTGIYAQIFTQLSWVAAQITGTPFEKETVSNNFSIVTGSISVTKGSFTQAGQIINWNVDFLNVETITLKYQVTPKPNICGDQIVSTSRLDYRNSQCNNSSQDLPTPNYCVPCAPVFSTLPGPSTINCPSTPNFITPTVTNGCVGSSLTYNDVRTNGNCAGSYSVTRTWTASNACFTTTTSQTINVQDITAPVIDPLPGPTTINCPAIPMFAQATASDACGSSFTLTFNDVRSNGNCANSYSITRTWTAKDGCNNTSTATQVINVQDVSTPTFTAPANTTIYTDAQCNYDASVGITGDVTNEADNCSTGLQATYTDSVADGQCQGSHVITRTWTLVDNCGNQAPPQVQTITVLDNIAPTFTAPANITIYADAQCNYDASVGITGDVTNEVDNCSTGLQATFTDSVADGQCQGYHIITRTWTLVDNCGNQATTQVQTITVLDNIAPTFTAPANATIYADAQCNYDASVGITDDVTNEADNCSTGLQATFTDSVADGQCQGSHVITRTWTLVDNCGNQAAPQAQTITVLDNIAPTFTAPANVTIYADAQCNYDASVGITGDVTNEADNCSTGLQATYTDSVADGQCQGSHVITRTWTLVDNCGNQAAPQAQTITVLDNIAPTFTAPANVTIYADAQCNYDASVGITGDVTNEADNCSTGLQATFTDSVADGQCQGYHVITRTWTLVDNCGNQATTQVQTIIVLDNIAPTFTAPVNITIYADAQCNYDASVGITGDVTNEADNCSTGLQATYTDSVADGQCQGSHVITRTWTLVDNCGNQTAPQVQTITVLDNLDPIVSQEFETEVSASCSNIPTSEPQFQDNCSGVTVVASPDNNTPVNVTDYGYILNQQWIATDDCGNQTEVIRTITVTIDKPFENIFVQDPICTDGGPIDLFSYLDPTIDHSGTWVDVNNSGGLTGSILDPMGIIAGVYKYRYTLSTGTCPRIIEVILTIKDDCIVLPCSLNDISISKVVTPNNDGYNDYFFIGGTEECGFKFNVKIFNRWGALVYENPNYKNDWDGKAQSAISSSNLPAGTYYYIVDIVDSGLDIFTGYIYLGTKN